MPRLTEQQSIESAYETWALALEVSICIDEGRFKPTDLHFGTIIKGESDLDYVVIREGNLSEEDFSRWGNNNANAAFAVLTIALDEALQRRSGADRLPGQRRRGVPSLAP